MSQFSPDSDQRDAELLERHLLTSSDDAPDPALVRFRNEQSQLIRVAERALAALRGQWRTNDDHVESTLVVTKMQFGMGRDIGIAQSAPRPRTGRLPASGTTVHGWSSRFQPRFQPRWRTAMAVMCAAIVVVGVLGRYGFSRRPDALAGRGAQGGHSGVADDIHYATRGGQRGVVTLKDGTRVMLAPQSKLQVTREFGRTTRIVSLSGEAYFDVAQARGTPFIVRTGAVTTSVLGTTFTVRRYPNEPVARVAVLTGKVGLSTSYGHNDPNTSVRVLTARTLGIASDSGIVRVVPGSAVDDYTAWTRGILVFRKALVSDIVADLGRAYDVEIQVADSTLALQTLTWTIPVQQWSLTDVLESLTTALDAHVRWSGRSINIVPKTAKTPSRNRPRNSAVSSPEGTYGR